MNLQFPKPSQTNKSKCSDVDTSSESSEDSICSGASGDEDSPNNDNAGPDFKYYGVTAHVWKELNADQKKQLKIAMQKKCGTKRGGQLILGIKFHIMDPH